MRHACVLYTFVQHLLGGSLTRGSRRASHETPTRRAFHFSLRARTKFSSTEHTEVYTAAVREDARADGDLDPPAAVHLVSWP
jgi:hypothetical protein